MKFYQRNKTLSYVLMIVSTICIGLWIALIVLHTLYVQSLHIFENQLFASGYNACKSHFSNIPYGGIPYDALNSNPAATTPAIPPYGDLLVMNHQVYQLLSLLFLWVSGVFQFVVLALSVFLLLKSRVPYKNMWYLSSLSGLKTSIYVLAWFGLVCGGLYYGYILTFYLQLGVRDCADVSLRRYAEGYYVNVIVGAVMMVFYLLNYGLAIGIRSQPKHIKEALENRGEEQTKVALQPLVMDVEAQRKVAHEELHNIPKINYPVQIEMVEQPPEGFQANYISQNYPNQSKEVIHLPSRFIPPLTHPQPNPQPYFYVPAAHQPLAVSQIQVNLQSNSPLKPPPPPNPYKIQSDSNFLASYASPSKHNHYPIYRNQQLDDSPSQRSRLKIFNRSSSGSKQQGVVGSLRNKYSRNY